MFLCFAEPRNTYGGLLNRLAALFTGGSYCHVTVVFELPQKDGTFKYQECSIVRSNDERFNRVHLSEVENMDGWTCYRLQLQRPEYELEAYNYVCNHLLGVHYDNIGSIADFTFCWCFPRGYRSVVGEIEKTYCSRLALEILHRTGQFLDHSSDKVSPNDLYKLIQRSKDRTACWTDVTPYAYAIFSRKYATSLVSYVYTKSQEYNGLLLF
jgi:hypothetical protein